MPVAFQETPILNADPTLNALTQLGALRLGVDRAFVSLIDRKYQYVVSEITRSHSLVDMKCAPGDHIAIGVCKINNCDGVCPATMKAFMDETGEWVQTGPDVIANRTRYIINDFRTHPDYKDRPYVTAYPFFTSYLEVPLVSPLGYLLGSYCVVDSHLNDFDSDDLVQVMNEVSSAIMSHFENVRIRQSRDRSEQLIEGLSGFMRNEPPLHRLPQLPLQAGAPENAASAGAPENAERATGAAADLRGPFASSTSNGIDDSSSTTSPLGSGPRPRPIITSSSSLESAPSALSLASAPRQEDSQTPPTTPRDAPGLDYMEQQMLAAIAQANADHDASSTDPPNNTPPDISEPHGFISSANIKTSFFRAAATIRRSMDLDGLMFLDAAPSSYVDRPDRPLTDSQAASSNELVEGPFCPVIVKSAIGAGGETATHSAQVRLPEVALQRFIQAYPEGHVFTADELGPIDDSYGVGKPFQSHPAEDQDSLLLRNDIAALFHVLPAAKYVVFLPLWHFQRECWYAATLGWVEDPTRAIGVADISLISAFGVSVMANVSRLEALAASRAKSDFVSSLSHELRSPLHGIMASSELLRDVISDRHLLATLDMLDSCATTLLDTFNNLLDHAIVTHSGPSSSLLAGIKGVDLGELVEDVVEAVKLGHQSGNGIDLPASAPAGQDRPDRPLIVTVQIAKYPWKLSANVGAWKRIVMNIFGNALKYTSAGHIEVGLKVMTKKDARTGAVSDCISLTVEDTGRGMSSDFLKYRLFTPFSQEDHHASGMGLGLSIVQQLVSHLGGVINVKSSLGIGTLVEILVPLGKDIPDPLAIGISQPDQHHSLDESDLNGRIACLITPDATAAIISNAKLEITKEDRSWSAMVERAFKVNAETCLRMDLAVATEKIPTPKAHLYILDCNMFHRETKQTRDIILQTWQSRVAPLVLLCPESGTPSCLKTQIIDRQGIHLHQPIGPRKIASVFRSALEAQSVPTESSDDFAPPPPRSPPSVLRETKEEGKTGNSGVSLGSIFLPQPPPPPNTPPNKRHHLLLVDDNPVNVKLLTHLVRRLGHTFATASDGLEAVKLYKSSLEEERQGQGQTAHRRRFDVVFMDITMPVMNGFEATREIRRLETEAAVGKPCKVVALTGLSSDENRSEAAASGCDLFLTKPVKMHTIRGLLDGEGKEG